MIYISYGITKSASTFLYQLTEEVFAVAGRTPRKLGPPYRPKGALDNYFDVVDEKLIQELTEVVGGDDLVIKTHGPPRGDIASLISSGAVLANASIRDPREIALSMLDHGKRAKRWKLAPFVEFQSLEDTLPSIDNQIGYFNAWAEIPKVEVSSTTRSASTAGRSSSGWRRISASRSTPIRFCRPSLATR